MDVIIVNFNAGTSLKGCLVSLEEQGVPDVQVIVIDNASTDGSAVELERRLPRVTVLFNPENLGFTRATNQGLARTTGEFALLLNPDVRLEPGALSVALQYLRENPRVAVVGARILLADGRLDPAARRSFKTPAMYLYKALGLPRIFPRSRRFGQYYLSYLDANAILDVDSVVGAFMLVRREALNEVGLLDERFFMYCEDEDLCWRLKQAGWRVAYHPGVRVLHAKGTSSRQVALRAAYHWHRSVFLYHRRNIAPRYSAPVNMGVYFLVAAGFAARATTAVALGATSKLRALLP